MIKHIISICKDVVIVCYGNCLCLYPLMLLPYSSSTNKKGDALPVISLKIPYSLFQKYLIKTLNLRLHPNTIVKQ